MSGKIVDRLSELGLGLPEVVKPVASYTPAKRADRLVFISGQLPMRDGKLMLSGAMTPGSDIAAAQAAMAQCFLNALAAAGLVADLDEIESVTRLGAFVASTPEFVEQHLVANGASDLAREIFGEAGVHARAAVGVPSLPLGAAVELEVLFQLKS